MNKRKRYECKYNDHLKNTFDLLKNSRHYTFKGKYGDRSREFVGGYWGEKYVPVVQKLDSAIHRIYHYSVDKYWGNQLHYPVDRDLYDG